jgi:hypothetical protein
MKSFARSSVAIACVRFSGLLVVIALSVLSGVGLLDSLP